jgi:hypothetical protein
MTPPAALRALSPIGSGAFLRVSGPLPFMGVASPLAGGFPYRLSASSQRDNGLGPARSKLGVSLYRVISLHGHRLEVYLASAVTG